MSRKKEKIYCFFVDISAAFGWLTVGHCFLKLFNLGITSKFIRSYYSDAIAAARGKQGMTECPH